MKNKQVIQEIIEFIKIINKVNSYKIILNSDAAIPFYLSPELF